SLCDWSSDVCSSDLIAEYVIEEQRDDIHRDSIGRIFDLAGDCRTDVGNEILRQLANGIAVVLWWQRLLQSHRQIETLPVTEGREKRCRGSQCHHRLGIE